MDVQKKIEIPVEYRDARWSTNDITIKRLKFGEQLRIQDEASKMRIDKSGVAGSTSQEIFAVALVMKSVVEAPWELNNPRVIFDLDVGLGLWVLEQVSEYNKVSDKKKVDSNNSSTDT